MRPYLALRAAQSLEVLRNLLHGLTGRDVVEVVVGPAAFHVENVRGLGPLGLAVVPDSGAAGGALVLGQLAPEEGAGVVGVVDDLRGVALDPGLVGGVIGELVPLGGVLQALGKCQKALSNNSREEGKRRGKRPLGRSIGERD